jgi:hypothetical protein
MDFKVYSNDEKPADSCKAVQIIKMLYDTKKFKYDFSAIGNCFQVAIDLLITIATSGRSTEGWLYVQGECPPPQGRHAWLEYDGWAIDFSSGDALFAPLEDYIKLKNPNNLERYTLKEVQEHIKSPEGRKKMDIWDY